VKTDAISIVEAAYDCESDTRTWLHRLLGQAAPKLDRGFGVSAIIYEPGVAPDLTPFVPWHMEEGVISAFIAMSLAYPGHFHRVNSGLAPMSTVMKTLKMTSADARSWPPFVVHMHPFGIQDVIGVVARDPTGCSIGLTVPMPDLRHPTPRERTEWSRIAAHISAGVRVRRALKIQAHTDLAEGADAVLSPSGSMVHAETGAQTVDARESLRAAAKAIDRARSKARGNDYEALDLWQGLVAGCWSLIEHFDSDGRRFMVARRNDPQVVDPRALNLRERQVLAYVAMGHPGKLIAYSLGVSPSSVSTSRSTAMRKLGLKTTADVIRLFAAPPGPESPQER
jgi:DNA-binding CsgD family transcriptional regulator